MRHAESLAARTGNTPLSGPTHHRPSMRSASLARRVPTPGSTTTTSAAPAGSSAQRALDHERGARDVVGGEVVRDVDDPRVGDGSRDGEVHLGDVAVVAPEVGHERDRGGALIDEGAADDAVAIVQHRGLTGRNAPLRLDERQGRAVALDALDARARRPDADSECVTVTSCGTALGREPSQPSSWSDDESASSAVPTITAARSGTMRST